MEMTFICGLLHSIEHKSDLFYSLIVRLFQESSGIFREKGVMFSSASLLQAFLQHTIETPGPLLPGDKRDVGSTWETCV
jgi:hypothetical protein